jgi:hypothetical protein
MNNTTTTTMNHEQYSNRVTQIRRSNEKRECGDSVLFSVRKEPLFTQDGTPADAWAIRRNDTKMNIGIVSENYEIIPTNEIVQETENVFNELGFRDFTRSLWSNRYGAGNYVQYDFRNHNKEVAKDDVVGLRMTLRNSYDGVSKASFTMGFVRLVCTNGMTSMSNDVFMTARHTANGARNFNIKSIVEEMVANYDEEVQRLSYMKDIHVPQQDGHNFIDNLWQSNRVVERVAKRVHSVWSRPYYNADKPRTLWNLYNAFTQTTRDMYEVRKTHGDIAMRVTRTIGQEIMPLIDNSHARERMFATPSDTCLN